jgi:hypothetical protein
MEFLVSAMYRGYDIAIDDSFDSGVVASAIKRYNKHLKGSGKKVVLHLLLEQVKTYLKINSVNGFDILATKSNIAWMTLICS